MLRGMRSRPFIHPFAPLDFAELLAIENASYPNPWPRRAFVEIVSPDCILRTAKRAGNASPLGYLLYSRRNSRFVIVKLAVDPIYRRQGIATELLLELTLRLNLKRPRIDAYVAESNLPAQLFLKAKGFEAISILCGADPYTGEDLYLMRFCTTKTETIFSVDERQPNRHIRGFLRPQNRVRRGQSLA
jgi:ribosomal protein S18 acetylase RimI-like enzyme